MSKVAFEAYSRGEVTLQDFVGVKHNRVWGEMRYERSFKDALKVAQKQGTTSDVPTLKAKGGFFADKTTLPYAAKGVIRGQATIDACVPVVCRMLIFDRKPHLERDINFSESYLRSFLQTDADGSAVAAIPAALRLAGITNYEYRAALTWEEFQQAVARGYTVASVLGKFGRHVLIVEEITDNHVAIRDSLPSQTGSSYWIKIDDFKTVWQAQKTARGSAVIVVK